MNSSTFEVILTIVLMSFWFLFTIGMFLSVSHIDKNADQFTQFQLQEKDVEEVVEGRELPQKVFTPVPFDWHHPVIYFRRWLQHE